MNVDRKHKVMAELLYPAFLGALIYDAAKKIEPANGLTLSLAGVLIVLLLLHYLMDYLYTITHRPADYSWWHFWLDAVIVLCLFFAVRGAMDANSMPWGLPPVAWLVVTKVAAVLWEFAEVPAGPRWRTKRLAIATDAVFGIFYVVAWVFSAQSLLALSAVVLLDVLAYCFYDRYSERVRREQSGIVVEVRVDAGDA
jgi:uncharacterized membrane protein